MSRPSPETTPETSAARSLESLAPSNRRRVREISRESVERIARIMGRNSASAQALDDADEHGGPCRFWQTYERGGSYIVVERL